MAPTEILAVQHYNTLSSYLEPFGIKVCLLTGSLPQKQKSEIKAGIKNGDYSLIVGTHAIIQKTTEYNNLGLVITDEQHRFGAVQRATLAEKGAHAHLLVMSATPIPRSLALALYGDLDGASVTQAAGLLGAAKMTASRAFDELAAVDPSIVAAEGRRRVLRPGRDKMAMWRHLEPCMSSPVAREHRLDRVPDAELPLGGLSALCELSMLQDDPWPTFVATKAQERTLELAADARDTGLDEPEDPACVVQVLRYEPVPAPGCAVDPLSAILSLPADERDDPRVADEIENVLNRVLGGGHEGNR